MILEKITQLSSHVEKIDGRLDLLESKRTEQAELQNSQVPLEREASGCRSAFEEEGLEYLDQPSVTAPPDQILDDSSPNVDNHDGYRVASITSKSLDPVQNINEDEAAFRKANMANILSWLMVSQKNLRYITLQQCPLVGYPRIASRSFSILISAEVCLHLKFSKFWKKRPFQTWIFLLLQSSTNY